MTYTDLALFAVGYLIGVVLAEAVFLVIHDTRTLISRLTGEVESVVSTE